MGVVSGVTTVLFGFGGGFVTVPAVYLATHGGDMHAAVATSTAVMIVNSGLATLDSARRHRILAQYLWPMALFIAAGAALGAYAALSAPERLLHWLFVAYLAVTIVDCLARRGFLSRQAGDSVPHELTRAESTLGGLLVGFVASFLGVGGSVMTVPFLRRKGADMAGATATANPLSLPVALCGSVVYASMGPGVLARPGRTRQLRRRHGPAGRIPADHHDRPTRAHAARDSRRGARGDVRGAARGCPAADGRDPVAHPPPGKKHVCAMHI